MMLKSKSEKNLDKLYQRALDIQDVKARGLWVPIMWHLVFQGHTDAMIDLADWLSESNQLQDFGVPSDAYSAAGLYSRAYKKGNNRAAQHIAMSCFNRNDLQGYRFWLRKAALAGDGAAALQLGCFETRLPHSFAQKIGRIRPEQKRDEFA